MDWEEATSHTRNGAIAACIVGTLTLGVVILAIAYDASGEFGLWNDPSNFADVAFVYLCAFGMYKNSRLAGIAMLFYYVWARIFISFETGRVGAGLVLALVFTYYFARAVQGAFVCHRIRKQEDPNYKPARRWMYVLGIPPTLVVVFLLICVLLAEIGVIPSMEVQGGVEISESTIATLRQHHIVSDQESVDFFYSQGLFSMLASGNVLTDEHVVFYYTDEYGDIVVDRLPLGSVTEVYEALDYYYALDDSFYVVDSADPDLWVELHLSMEEDGHERFLAALYERIPDDALVDGQAKRGLFSMER